MKHWADRAACKDKPQRWFFPERGEAPGCYERARQLCRECTVVAPCLREAMSDKDMVGFWAGTTAMDRLNLRRGGKFVRCVVCDVPFVQPRWNRHGICSKLCRERASIRRAS